MIVEGKPGIYQLFAHIFAKEPSQEFIQLLQQEENEELFNSLGTNPLSDMKQLSIEDQVESLAVEYANLFLTPPNKIPLNESLHRGEGRLWGDSTVAVNRIYRKFGFELDDNFKDTPDHLSAELFFLSQLSKLEVEYEEKGLSEAKAGILEVKKYFLKHHLLQWIPLFKDKVEKIASLSYYKAIVQLLGVILEEEWGGLKDVREISPQ